MAVRTDARPLGAPAGAHLARDDAPSNRCQPTWDIWYVNVLPPLVKVSERSLPVQLYEPCSGEDVTGLVTPATVMVALSVTVETGKVPERDVVLGGNP